MTPHLDHETSATGPRTAEGKSRCRLNAVRHGLTAQTLCFTPEESQKYVEHLAGLHVHYQPTGPIETALVAQIADGMWRLDRASAIEHGIFALAIQSAAPEPGAVDSALAPARTWLAESKNLALLTLYVKRIENKLSANKAELAALQDRRKSEAEAAMRDAMALRQAAESEGKPYKPEEYFNRPPRETQSVFSPRMVDYEIRRADLLQSAHSRLERRPAPPQTRPAALRIA
jgi:hypothetical protein